jgi:uncharacterized protein (DUF2336 family)
MSSTERRHSLLIELESAMNSRDAHERTTVLDRITDLIFNVATDADRAVLFDDVFLQLIRQVDVTARAKLARRLADVSTALDLIIQSLAQDEVIDVAEPVLARSPQVSEASLIQVARTRGQAHLLAIAGRSSINAPVSDVLVNRGDVGVLRRLSGNLNAKFSERGIDALTVQAAKDEQIAENLVTRSDIPSSIYRRLLSEATDRVRGQLLNGAGPEQCQIITHAVDEVCKEFSQTDSPEMSADARRGVRHG